MARDDVSQEPTSTVEEAANAALDAAKAVLEDAGGSIDRCFILLLAQGLPKGEVNGTTAGYGYDGADAHEAAVGMLAHVLAFAEEAGKGIGVRIQTVPMPRGGHG